MTQLLCVSWLLAQAGAVVFGTVGAAVSVPISILCNVTPRTAPEKLPGTKED